VRIGFCGPLVCNRMLLWGLFGTLLIGLSIVVIFHYAAYCEANVFYPWSGSVGLVVCWLEIVPVVLIWLVFFPPAGATGAGSTGRLQSICRISICLEVCCVKPGIATLA
jgi:hypothetical protein